MTIADIRREIEALPDLSVEGAPEKESAAEFSPLQVISRQGRLILRLTASTEALDARYKELAERMREQAAALAQQEAELRERDARVKRLIAEAEEARREGQQEGQEQARRVALEAIRMMDALDWAQDALDARGEEALSREFASARRDCVRRLTAIGITEVPCEGMMDGRLHEGLETLETNSVPRYHIVRVLRRGWQCGPDVLRRAGVVTAA